MSLESFLVFHPDTAKASWRDPVDPRTQDVWLQTPDGTPVHAWWIPPERPEAGAILLAHGNGGNLSHRGRLAANLRAKLGAGVLLFDYAGYGHSGGELGEHGCYAAGEAAYRWLTTDAGVPANRVILFGKSLGGGTMVELATRHDHRALVLVFTFTSLPAAAKYHYPWLPTYTLMRNRFDNLSKIGRCPRPVFIAHGTADATVPFVHSEQLFAAAKEPKEFLQFDGMGHDVFIFGDRFTDALARFLEANAP